jgi:hypothetical protein
VISGTVWQTCRCPHFGAFLARGRGRRDRAWGGALAATPRIWRKRTSSPRSGRPFVIRHFRIIEIAPNSAGAYSASLQGLLRRRREMFIALDGACLPSSAGAASPIPLLRSSEAITMRYLHTSGHSIAGRGPSFTHSLHVIMETNPPKSSTNLLFFCAMYLSNIGRHWMWSSSERPQSGRFGYLWREGKDDRLRTEMKTINSCDPHDKIASRSGKSSSAAD